MPDRAGELRGADAVLVVAADRTPPPGHGRRSTPASCRTPPARRGSTPTPGRAPRRTGARCARPPPVRPRAASCSTWRGVSGCASTPSPSAGPRLMSTTAWKLGGCGRERADRALRRSGPRRPRAAARCGGARTRSWRRPSCPCPGPRTASRPRCPGHTSTLSASESSRSCSERKIAARALLLVDREVGRAMSPTNRVSPVSTAHGSAAARGVDQARTPCARAGGRACAARARARLPSCELPAVVERLVVVVRLGASRWMWIVAPVARGEPAVAGHVVGVVVRLEDVLDRHAHVAREAQVLVDLELRDRRPPPRRRPRPRSDRKHSRGRRGLSGGRSPSSSCISAERESGRLGGRQGLPVGEGICASGRLLRSLRRN